MWPGDNGLNQKLQLIIYYQKSKGDIFLKLLLLIFFGGGGGGGDWRFFPINYIIFWTGGWGGGLDGLYLYLLVPLLKGLICVTAKYFGCTMVLAKNPAYGRHQLSRPMRIVGPIQI